MIECWFNETGYRIRGSIGESQLVISDCPDDTYDARWYVLGRMMEILTEGESLAEPVIIYHDSRLVEELTNKAEPLNDYGKAARGYFLAFDSVKMPFLQIKKTNSTVVNRMISEQTRSPAASATLKKNR